MLWAVDTNEFYVFVNVKLIPHFQHGQQDAINSPRMVEQSQRLSKERNLDSSRSLTFNNGVRGLAQVYRGYH